MTLLNSNYEEWHAKNIEKPYTEFPFNIKKMSVSGCLFDFNKLNDVSKNILSRMTAEEVYEKLTVWASAFDPDFAEVLTADKGMAIKILAIGRGGKKPRKDLATWADAKPYMGFFYDKFFTMEDEYPAFDKEIIKATLEKFLETYNYADEMNVWFDKIKAIADSLGFASDMKAYKANPEAFKGNVADISAFIRVAVTGKQNAPDLYTVMQIIGEEKTRARVSAQIEALK
jgi:glutamyl-tRNA synthetase